MESYLWGRRNDIDGNFGHWNRHERWDESQTWEDRYIDEYYGLFLSEDAQKLLKTTS